METKSLLDKSQNYYGGGGGDGSLPKKSSSSQQQQKHYKDSSMCDFSGCTNPIAQQCYSCARTMCVRHITQRHSLSYHQGSPMVNICHTCAIQRAENPCCVLL